MDNQITKPTSERPLLITIICILGFLGSFMLLMILSIRPSNRAELQIYTLLTALIGFICIVGLWLMKKWGAYGYIGLALIGQIFLISMGAFSLFSFTIPAAVVTSILIHWKKFS